MSKKDKRYPVAIDDLLIEFDEMDYCPMNLSGDDPVKEAINWKDRLRCELDLLLDEKSAIERRAVEEFAERLKGVLHNDYIMPSGNTDERLVFECIDEVLKGYKDEQES